MNAIITVINELSTTVLPALWRASWQGGLALLFVFVLCRIARRIPAQVQCWLWRLAILKLLIAAAWITPIELHWLPTPPVKVSSQQAIKSVDHSHTPPLLSDDLVEETNFNRAELTTPLPHHRSTPTIAAAPVPRLTLGGWLLLAWLGGVTFFLARLLRHWLSTRQFLSRTVPITSGPVLQRLAELGRQMRVSREPGVCLAENIRSPFLIGLRRPLIVLPTAAVESYSADELDAVLIHELAHIRRRDLVWNWLPAAAETLFFFHPLIWLTHREWRLAQEIATDELAITSTHQTAARYAHSLLGVITRSPHSATNPHLAVALSEAYMQLDRRLNAMKDYRRPTPRRRTVIAAILLVLASLGIVPWKLTANELPAEPVAERNESDATLQAKESDPRDDTVSSQAMKVHVVDASGQPLGGAEVFRNHVYEPEGEKRTRIENETYWTDDKGVAEVALSGTTVDLRLWVRKENFVPLHAMWARDFQVDGGQVPDEFTFRLQPGTVIGGIVRNEAGEPIAGAKIEVEDRTTSILNTYFNSTQDQPVKRPVRASWLAEDDGAVFSDANGRWQLTNVPSDETLEDTVTLKEFEVDDRRKFALQHMADQIRPQKVALRLSHPDYADDYETGGLQQSQGVTFESLRDQTATIVMSEGHSLSGGVTDPAGRPIADALVVLGDDDLDTDRVPRCVRTDNGGSYRFDHLSGPPQLLRVLAKGWPLHTEAVSVNSSDEVDVTLERGRLVVVRFVDPAGNAVSDVRIAILDWNHRRFLELQYADSLSGQVARHADGDGRFEVTLAPGDHMLCNFVKDGYHRLNHFNLTPEQSTYTVTLTPDSNAEE